MAAVDTHRMRLGGLEGEEIRSEGQVLALGGRRQEAGGGGSCTRTSAAGIPSLTNSAAAGANTIATDGGTAQKAYCSTSSPLPGSAGNFDGTEKNLRKRSRRQTWTPQKGEDQEAGGRIIIFGANRATFGLDSSVAGGSGVGRGGGVQEIENRREILRAIP